MIYLLNNYVLYMDELAERIEDNFINIYNKFDILDKKINNYHMKFHKINEMIDIIISDEYTKIYKNYYPMKNYDLMQDQFFIYNAIINILLKKNTFITFEYIFEAEYINIPLIINLKIDNVLEKDFNIHLKKHNKIRHIFKLEYNITESKFYLYLYTNEIYNDNKMEYLKKYYLIIKKLNLIYFLLYKYMAYYYRRPINKTVYDVKLKKQIGILTVKITENVNKINDLIEVDKTIKKHIDDNSNKIVSMNESITNYFNRISINEKNIKFKTDTINSNIDEMKSNLNNFDLTSNSKYSIENFFIYNIETENSYKLSKDTPKFSIFNYNLISEFRKNNILEINCRLLYQYTNYNNIGFLLHIFKLYDRAGTMFYEYKSLLTNAGDNKKNDLKQNDMFYVKLDDDYGVIKIELILSIIDNVTNKN